MWRDRGNNVQYNGRVYIETTTGQRPKTIRLEAQDARTGWRRYKVPKCIAAERAHKGHSCAVYHNIIIVYYYGECAAAIQCLRRLRGVKSFVYPRGECILIIIYICYVYIIFMQFSEYIDGYRRNVLCANIVHRIAIIYVTENDEIHSLIYTARSAYNIFCTVCRFIFISPNTL